MPSQNVVYNIKKLIVVKCDMLREKMKIGYQFYHH